MFTSSAVAPEYNVQGRPGARAAAPWRAGQVFDGLLGLLVTLLGASSWVTHIVVCVTEGLWAFLVFGIVIFPVALLHGIVVCVAACI